MKWVTLLSMCICSIQLSAGTNRLKFKNSLEFTGNSIIDATVVEKVYKDNKWESIPHKTVGVSCDISLKISGRDIARSNDHIGEHLYGKIKFDCTKKGGFFSSDKHFVVNYSRVLVLGVRNCVRSDNQIDNDYCKLLVVAYKKIGDLSKKNGDLLKNSNKKLKYWQISSTNATNFTEEKKLIPQGLNRSRINGQQVFNLSLGSDGDVFINTGSYSNFSSATEQVSLVLSSDQSENLELIEQEIDETLDELYNELEKVGNSSNQEEQFKKIFSASIRKFAKAVGSLQTIINPVVFFALEARLLDYENALINLAANFNIKIKNRNDLIINYGTELHSYKKIVPYIKNGKIRDIPILKPINVPGVKEPAIKEPIVKVSVIKKTIIKVPVKKEDPLVVAVGGLLSSVHGFCKSDEYYDWVLCMETTNSFVNSNINKLTSRLMYQIISRTPNTFCSYKTTDKNGKAKYWCPNGSMRTGNDSFSVAQKKRNKAIERFVKLKYKTIPISYIKDLMNKTHEIYICKDEYDSYNSRTIYRCTDDRGNNSAYETKIRIKKIIQKKILNK